MKLGMIGLGRMGANMARRLIQGGHSIVGFDPDPDARKALESDGAQTADSLKALVESLPGPRNVWMMVPAGDITESTVGDLLALLDAGDTLTHYSKAHYLK